MENSTERARANPKPPPLNETDQRLRELLAIECERLATAVRIERERSIVFPETSVIIHDIWKLTTEIEARNRRQARTRK